MFSNRVVADEILAQSRLTELSQMTQLLEGFTLRPDIWTDQLALDEERFVETELAVGNEYVILLASDTRQHGIFVEVLTQQNIVIARSEASDNEVLCRVVPPVTGTYIIHIVRPVLNENFEQNSESQNSESQNFDGILEQNSESQNSELNTFAIFAARLAYR